MAVLDRGALEESPLADLHTIAGELGLDGFRRLRKAELIDSIVERQGGAAAAAASAPAAAEAAEEEAPKRRPRARSRRKVDGEEVEAEAAAEATSTRARSRPRRKVDEEVETEAEAASGRRARSRRRVDEEVETEAEAEAAKAAATEERVTAEDTGEPRPARSRTRSRSRSRDGDGGREGGREPEAEKIAEGTVELLGNGSGFLRVSPPDPSDDDVYISAAQVRRCELVSGDAVTGPVRAPRRSERYPSLIRVDTINGRPADEVTEGTPFDELPAAFPTQRFALGGEDDTLKAIEWLTPIGRGSRATIVGAARAGKSEALRRLAGALAGLDEGLEISVVLAGVRPEEITAWKGGPVEPVAATSFAASPDASAGAVERALDTAKRIAARGGHAVVLIDSLSALPIGAARRTLAAARDIVGGGSLTIVATADAPIGGETTVIALDVALTSTGRFPALDLVASGTLRPELLVGDAGADAIAQARAAALA